MHYSPSDPTQLTRFGCLQIRRFTLVATLFLVLPLAVANAAAPAERPLAPGVLTTIPPSFEPSDTVSTHDIVEMRADPNLKWKPSYLSDSKTLVGKSQGVRFHRDIYCLEFSFKPMRMIEVAVPQANGAAQRKLVWYMVYRVRNTGQVMKPIEGQDGVFGSKMAPGGPIQFVPQFVLESHDRMPDGQPVSKAYLDRIIPAAVRAISQRETPGRMLLNSVEMAEQQIQPSNNRIDKSDWGVATWTDVDPRLDFLSVYVGGLTNAYEWQDTPNAYKHGDPPGKGRRFTMKTLQLNFWRPGDDISPDERELRYGVPLNNSALYGVPPGVAYQWVYR